MIQAISHMQDDFGVVMDYLLTAFGFVVGIGVSMATLGEFFIYNTTKSEDKVATIERLRLLWIFEIVSTRVDLPGATIVGLGFGLTFFTPMLIIGVSDGSNYDK